MKRIGIWILIVGLSLVLFAGCARNYRRMIPDYEAQLQALKDMESEEKAPYETAKVENYLELFKGEVEENDPIGSKLFSGKLDYWIQQAGLKTTGAQ